MKIKSNINEKPLCHYVTSPLNKGSNIRPMKDSGIQWIGQIPEDWKVTSLKRFVGVSDGTHDTPQYVDISENTYPLVTSKCIVNGKIDITLANHISNKDYDEINKRSKVNINDVIMPMIGTVGNPALVESNTDFAIKNVALLRTNGSYELGKWVWYLLNSKVALTQFDLVIRGGVQNFISQEKLGKMVFPFCENNKMKNIVNFLDQKCSAIDSVLEKTKASIEEYKKLKQSIITQTVTKGIQPNRQMKDSGNKWFGEIPSAWETKKIKFVFTIKKDIAGKEGYTVLSITQKGIIPKDLSKNEGQLAENYSNYQLVNIGDFAMNHMDLLTGGVDISKYNGVTSPDYRVFILNDKVTNNDRYFLYLMRMCYSNKIFYGLGAGVSGMGRWRLQADKFLNFIIPIPPKDEQLAIADYLDTKCTEIDNLIAKKEQFIKEIEAYKKSLIYEYVTGKKEVAKQSLA